MTVSKCVVRSLFESRLSHVNYLNYYIYCGRVLVNCLCKQPIMMNFLAIAYDRAFNSFLRSNRKISTCFWQVFVLLYLCVN